MTFSTMVLVPVGMGIIKTIVYAYGYLTWPLYYMFKKSLNYIPLPDSPYEPEVKYRKEENRVFALPVRQNDPSAPWRAVESMDGLADKPIPGCETLPHIWFRTIKLYGDQNAFGTRAILATDYEASSSGKQMVKLTLGDYSWETYNEAEIRVSNLAAGLHTLLGPLPSDSDQRQSIAIFSETRAEWLYTAMAIFRLNRPMVTLYSTLGDDALIHAFNESQSAVVFTSDELVSKIMLLIKNCPSIRHIIYFSNGIYLNKPVSFLSNSLETQSESVPLVASGNGGIGNDSAAQHTTKYSSLERLNETARVSIQKARTILAKLKMGDELQLHDIVEIEELGRSRIASECPETNMFWMPPVKERPTREDLAIVMYTSGSTGTPKGVEMTHYNIVSSLAGFIFRLPKPRNGDIYIAYLPLAHVLELSCELTVFMSGVKIGYSNPQTLTDTSSRIKIGACKGDLAVLRPTHMATVPTVLERISKAVWEKVSEGGEFSKQLFRFAYDYKCRRLHDGFPSFLVDRLVFRRVRLLIGGKVRLLLSGGAPVAEDSHLFANVCFAPIIQGYGLTETSASAAIMEYGDLRCNHVGPPLPSVELKLRPWLEGGYSPLDQVGPRGEILISGGPVSRGYYRQPELTARDFVVDSDGKRWFCTGDIGMLHPDGCLSVIDRKKDLVKLQAGEYVSLSKVEVALRTSIYVENICVYADPTQSYTICFVSPKRRQLKNLAKELGLEHLIKEASENWVDRMEKIEPGCSSRPDLRESRKADEHLALCRSELICQAVLKDLKKCATEKRLVSFEVPQKVYLDSDLWTPETGLVTDALKLKRINLQQRFQSEIDRMYNRGSRL